MIEFNIDTFADHLRGAPERTSIFEQEEYSVYLQEKVFDPLSRGESLDIKELDYSAYSLNNVTTDSYAEGHNGILRRWGNGFNSFVKRTPAVVTDERKFF